MEDSFKDTERSDAQNSEEAKKNNISMIFLERADLEIEETKEYSAQTRNQGFQYLKIPRYDIECCRADV